LTPTRSADVRMTVITKSSNSLLVRTATTAAWRSRAFICAATFAGSSVPTPVGIALARLPQDLALSQGGAAPAAEHDQGVRQAVQVGDDVRTHGLRLREPQHFALGAPADRARVVQRGVHCAAAREDETA